MPPKNSKHSQFYLVLPSFSFRLELQSRPSRKPKECQFRFYRVLPSFTEFSWLFHAEFSKNLRSTWFLVARKKYHSESVVYLVLPSFFFRSSLTWSKYFSQIKKKKKRYETQGRRMQWLNIRMLNEYIKY